MMERKNEWERMNAAAPQVQLFTSQFSGRVAWRAQDAALDGLWDPMRSQVQNNVAGEVQQAIDDVMQRRNEWETIGKAVTKARLFNPEFSDKIADRASFVVVDALSDFMFDRVTNGVRDHIIWRIQEKMR